MKIHLVNNNNGDGDWKGIYINGSLFTEGHSLHLEEIIEEIASRGEAITQYQRTCFDDEQMEEMGCHFPMHESDLPAP